MNSTDPDMAARRRPSTQDDLTAIKHQGPARRRIEGVAFHGPVLRQSITAVDFVDCDMTGLVLDKPRLGSPITVRDCTFTSCDWGSDGYSGAIANARFQRCAFTRCVFTTTAVVSSVFADCRFQQVHFEGLNLFRTALTSVSMGDVDVRKSHWEHSMIEASALAGRARTLVLSDTGLNDVDLSGMKMVDCDLGDRVGAKVRFPVRADSFVVPGGALEDADAELAGALSPAALVSFRRMRDVLFNDFVVVDPSLFRPVPDLPDMDMSPSEVDAILAILFRSHVVASADVPDANH